MQRRAAIRVSSLIRRGNSQPGDRRPPTAAIGGRVDESLDALEEDHEFLLRGDVFTSDVIETWLHYKRTEELDEVRLRPHPYEFVLYYDA